MLLSLYLQTIYLHFGHCREQKLRGPTSVWSREMSLAAQSRPAAPVRWATSLSFTGNGTLPPAFCQWGAEQTGKSCWHTQNTCSAAAVLIGCVYWQGGILVCLCMECPQQRTQDSRAASQLFNWGLSGLNEFLRFIFWLHFDRKWMMLQSQSLWSDAGFSHTCFVVSADSTRWLYEDGKGYWTLN